MIKNTPPMGFNTWNTFGENISEELVLEMVDVFEKKHLKDYGYEYIVIDDCWSKKERDENGKLVADPVKFPHGMKYLADYIHSKGLKFGMYSCSGTKTCAGYPSSFGHEYVDAATFAEWDVDFLKYDYCNRPDNVESKILYRRMGLALANCGKEILFSACSWGEDNTHEWIRTTSSSAWRSTTDINDSWASIKNLIELQYGVLPFGGKGCFNDMDMLVVGMHGKGLVGVKGCTLDEYKLHFGAWCLFGSPLMIGCDLRTVDDESMNIMLNKDLIDIDQDELSAQCYLLALADNGGLAVAKNL